MDSVEFLVKPADRIVLYRSFSRDTLFVYPIQRPVSDQGNIKERLEGKRRLPCRKALCPGRTVLGVKTAPLEDDTAEIHSGEIYDRHH